MPNTTCLTRPTGRTLDRDVSLAVLGVPLIVRAHGADATAVAAAVEQAWGWCRDAAPSGAEVLVVDVLLDRDDDIVRWAAGRGWVAAQTLDVLLHNLSPAITARAIEHLAGRSLMFHACALADPVTSAAALFVGPSGMGKTTLSRQLGRSLGYVTDETAAVAPDGTLRLFPKPLSILGGSGHLKSQVCPGELGLLRPPPRPRVAAVVLLDRRPDAPAEPVVSRVDLLPAVAALAEQVSYLKRLDKPLHQLTTLLRAVGGPLRLSYRDGADLLPVVRPLLRGKHESPQVAQP